MFLLCMELASDFVNVLLKSRIRIEGLALISGRVILKKLQIIFTFHSFPPDSSAPAGSVMNCEGWYTGPDLDNERP